MGVKTNNGKNSQINLLSSAAALYDSIWAKLKIKATNYAFPKIMYSYLFKQLKCRTGILTSYAIGMKNKPTFLNSTVIALGPHMNISMFIPKGVSVEDAGFLLKIK